MAGTPIFHIAMIGDSSTVRGFAAAGVHPFPATDSDQAYSILVDLIEQGRHAIIFITESIAKPIIDLISDLPTGSVPAVIVIPDQSGVQGIGFNKIRSAVERAIGIDLIGQIQQRQTEGS